MWQSLDEEEYSEIKSVPVSVQTFDCWVSTPFTRLRRDSWTTKLLTRYMYDTRPAYRNGLAMPKAHCVTNPPKMVTFKRGNE